MTVFQRYLLIQVPGAVLAGLALYALHVWFGLPRRWAIVLMVVYVLKDLILYPFLRRSYEPGSHAGPELLIGQHGTAAESFDAEGYVLVRGELWKARLVDGSAGVQAQSAVRVVGADGLTLHVAPYSGEN